MSSRPDPRLLPLAILTVLLILGAALVYRVPVHRYVVSCERATTVVCDLEQIRTGGRARRWRVALDSGTAAAVVRIVAQRRGPDRVLLYLEAPGRDPVFAAQFEGADAPLDAEAAAARLNQVLRRSPRRPTAAPRAARIEAVAPAILRWVAWGGLGVMGLLILATYRQVRAQNAAAA